MKDLGETLHSFIAKQETFNSQTAQTLENLIDTLAKLASTLSIHEKGKFPSQILQNPKDQSNPSTSSSTDHYLDQVKSVITLHNGKVVEKHIPDTYEKDDESISKNKGGVNEPSPNVETTESVSMPPFPQALT